MVSIVGRESELATLAKFVEDAGDEPTALVVEGDAGMGKTTLWNACIDNATANGRLVLSCGPGTAERRLAFAALDDLLRDVVDEALPALPAPQRNALEAALLLERAGDEPPDPRTIAVAFLSCVRELASRRPVLIAIDDAQWIDPSSARLVEFAARRLRNEQVGLLVARRTETSAEPPFGLGRTFGDDLRHLELEPLTVGAIQHLVRTDLGVALPRPALRQVYETSGGNPFYALELARALARRDPIEPGHPLPVPSTLDGLVRERLAGQPDSVQHVLAVVSALCFALALLVRFIHHAP